jgi:hypothetical protein
MAGYGKTEQDNQQTNRAEGVQERSWTPCVFGPDKFFATKAIITENPLQSACARILGHYPKNPF